MMSHDPDMQDGVARARPTNVEVNGAETTVYTIPLRVTVQVGTPPPAAARGAPSATPDFAASPQLARAIGDALAELRSAAQRPYYDAAADQADRDAYYRGELLSLEGRALYEGVSALLKSTHEPSNYAPARNLYPWVDLRPDLRLRSVYSGDELDAEQLIAGELRAEAERLARREALLHNEALSPFERVRQADALEAAESYNCEHVVPQSWFNKREPMRGDLHHLFACNNVCNSFRGNTPYYDFPSFQGALKSDCGLRETAPDKGAGFEPSGGKGAVARATLYFLLRYPGEINDNTREYPQRRLSTLLQWHERFPVDDYERHRNAAIYAKQGNRNPLIDFPELARKIDFKRGLR